MSAMLCPICPLPCCLYWKVYLSKSQLRITIWTTGAIVSWCACLLRSTSRSKPHASRTHTGQNPSFLYYCPVGLTNPFNLSTWGFYLLLVHLNRRLFFRSPEIWSMAKKGDLMSDSPTHPSKCYVFRTLFGCMHQIVIYFWKSSLYPPAAPTAFTRYVCHSSISYPWHYLAIHLTFYLSVFEEGC